MTWINLSSVSVANGSKTVTINSGLTTNVKVGDALLIGNEAPVEISGVFASQLILRSNWPNPTATNAAAAVMPTSGEFTTATQALREATNVTQGNFAEMEKWWTQLGTVTFKSYDNSEHVVRTAQQMDSDVQAQIDETKLATNEMIDLLDSQLSLSQPEVFIPFNDSVQIERGFGTHDQIDVSAAQDGSVMVELPTKSVDFSRASARTLFNKSGELVIAGVDEPCIGPNGLEVYQSYANLMPYSENVSLFTVSQSGIISYESGIGLDGIEKPCLMKADGVQSSAYEIVNTVANKYYVFSFFVRSDNTNVARLGIYSEALASWLVSVKEYAITSEWTKITIPFQAAAAGGNIRAYAPRFESTELNSEYYVDAFQLTETITPMPYVKTNGAQVSVSADVCTIPIRGNMPELGRPFTILVDCAIPLNTEDNSTVFRNGVSSVSGFALRRMSTGNVSFYISDGLTTITVQVGGVDDSQHRFVVRFNENNEIQLIVDGSIFSTVSVITKPVYNLNLPIGIGSFSGSASQYLNSSIKKLSFYHRALSDAEITALGAPR